ncbi:hypothetical protein L1281_002284 [Neisseria sp. HSC-16F19]|nr:hypothetical protein [Neisseria sp. HSC-16F19]MCP2041673.1 hypothetical protein [Neisseria sp. HSC-16F19]
MEILLLPPNRRKKEKQETHLQELKLLRIAAKRRVCFLLKEILRLLQMQRKRNMSCCVSCALWMPKAKM